MKIEKGKIILSESEEQANFVAYCRNKDIRIFSIPNGSYLGKSNRRFGVINKLKKEGMSNGVPDLYIPIITEKYAGLFIEFKRKNGKKSDLRKGQEEWLEYLNNEGYKAEVAFGCNHAKEILENYLGGDVSG